MCKARCVSTERAAPTPPDRLSVAFDATPLLGSPTGVGAFCAGALAGLADRADLTVSGFAVSWRRRAGIADRVPPGVPTRHRPMPARPLHWCWSRWDRPPVDWFVGRHDVVHGSNFVVPPTAHGARVVTVHDLTVVRFPELCEPPTLRFPALVRRAVAQGAWVHTPSRFVAEEVVAELGVDPSRVRPVHHGIPPLPADRGRDRDGPCTTEAAGTGLSLPEGCSRYVLAVGTVEPRKDYPSLIRAFTALAAGHPDLALVVVGADGWDAPRVAAAIAASPAPACARIVRPGYLAAGALGTVLRGAAVLAYPSRYEGFGFPPLQAMAAGTPVVATSAGAVPEVVGDAALLVDPGDADGLGGALDRVLAGGREVDALVSRGLARAATFSWSSCAEGLAAVYREAVGAATAGATAGR